MTITVKAKTINAGTFEVQVMPETKISDFKVQLANVSNVTVDKQRLIFRGKVLADDATLATYGIDNNDTIHLVIKKDDAPAATPTSAASTTTTSTTNDAAAAPQVMSASAAFVADPSAVNNMLTSVLGSLGLAGQNANANVSVNVVGVGAPMQNGAAAPNGSAVPAFMAPMMPVAASTPPLSTPEQLRQLLNAVSTDLDAFGLLTFQSDTGARNTALETVDFSSAIANLSQLDAIMTRVLPAVHRLNESLQREAHLTTPQTRQEVERLTEQVGLVLRRIGHGMQNIGRRLCMIEFGSTAGQATLNPNRAAAQPQVAPGSSMFVVSGAPFMMSPAAAMAPAPVPANAGAGAAPVPNIAAALQSMFGGLPASQPAPVRTPSTSASPAPVSAPAPAPAPVQAPSSASAPVASSAAAPPMPDLSALLGSLTGAAGRGGANGAGAGQANGLANLMNSMMPMVSQMMGGLDMNALANMSGVAQGGLIDEIFSRAISTLSIPELLGIVTTGDISPLDKMQGTLRDLVAEELDDEIDSDSSRQALAEGWAEELAGMLERDLPPAVQANLRSGNDIVAISHRHLTKNIRSLIDVLAGPALVPTSAQPAPFADALRDWGLMAFGGWVDELSGCFNDGINSVNSLLRHVITQKLNQLGPQFGMISGLAGGFIGSMLQRLHTAYRQRIIASQSANPDLDVLAQEKWTESLPEAERGQWCSTIARDLKRQLEEPSVPASEEYATGKRRKVSPSAASSLAQLISNAASAVGASATSAEELPSALVAAFEAASSSSSSDSKQ